MMEQSINIIISVSLMLVGLCIGSFVNVLIYRIPSKISIVSPPSHCPSCKKQIRWYDNIPIFSYLILKGKCRNCSTRISIRYFLVELLNILLWIAGLVMFGLTVYSVAIMLLSSVLITIAFIDAEHQIIPDSLNIAVAVIGVVLTIISIFDPSIISAIGTFSTLWWERLIGGSLGGILFAGIYYLYLWIRKKEGLGGGDVKFIAAVGLVLGFKLTLLCIGLSALVACLYLLAKSISGKLNTNSPFAFGPFLAIGTMLSIFVGNYLISLYLSLF